MVSVGNPIGLLVCTTPGPTVRETENTALGRWRGESVIGPTPKTCSDEGG